jgi:hypothetical protein
MIMTTVQQRKLPAKRLFHGAAGSPLSYHTDAPEPGTTLVDARRAMTPAERQRKCRELKRKKEQDSEKRTVIAKLIKIYKSEQGTIIVRTDDKIKTACRFQREYIAGLHELSLDVLKAILGVAIRDAHGRLPGERSGENVRRFGQSEIERLQTIREHTEHGRCVRPEGYGPDTLVLDEKNELSPNWAKGGKVSALARAKEDKMFLKLYKLVRQVFNRTGHCLLLSDDGTPCTFRASDTDFAVEHLLQTYYAGEKQRCYADSLRSFDVPYAAQLEPILIDALKRVEANVHHGRVSECLRKRDTRVLKPKTHVTTVQSTR